MNINTGPLFGRLFGLIAVLLLLQISQHVDSATQPSVIPEDMKPIEPPWQDVYSESSETTDDPATTTEEPTTTTTEPTTTTPEPTTTTPEPTTTTPEPTTTTPESTTTTPQPKTTPPAFKPKDIRLATRTYGSINITWSDESNASPTYNVTCQRQVSGDANQQGDTDCVCDPPTGALNQAMCKVPGQDSGQLMIIKVLPEQLLGDTCDDCSILVVSEPAPPGNLNAEAVNETSVSVTWDAPAEDMTKFTYSVAVVGVDPWNTTETSLVVSGLTANANHNVTVMTYSTYREDTAPGEVNRTTSWTYANPVDGLKVDPKDTSLTVSWDKRDDDGLKGYVILVMDMDDSGKCILEAHLHSSTDFPYENGCGQNRSEEITDPPQYTTDVVQACSNYNVTVYVKNEAGNSDSKRTNKRTLVAEPRDQVKNVMLTPHQKRINVTWDKAQRPGRCPIVQYLIAYNYTDCNSTDGSVLTNSKTVEGTTLTTDLTGLQPYWNYTVVVSARTVIDGGVGNSSSDPSERRTLIDEPKKPTSLNVTNGEGKTVVLTWYEPGLCDRNGPISSYNVSYICKNLAVNAGTELEEDTQKVHKTTYTFTIGSYRNCTFSVAAINVEENQVDLQGPPATQIHSTPEGAPSLVRNVSVKETGPTWVQLTWFLPSEPNGVIKNYNISYTPLRFADGKGYPIASANSNITFSDETTFNVSGLHEYTTYEFTVFGITNGGDGNMSGVKTADTKVGDPQPVEKIASTSWKNKIEVTWTLPRRTGPTNYSIQAATLDSSNKTFKSVVIQGYNNTKGEVGGLSPYTNYTITVVTVMETGEASTSGQIKRTNEDVPKSVEYAYLNSTSTSVNVFWEPPSTPNGEILQYTVVYRALSYADGLPLPTGATEYVFKNTTGPVQSIVLVDQISPFTRYVVKIYGWTSVGRAENSTGFENDTKHGDPEPVSQVVEAGSGATHLTVTWIQPAIRSGNTSYRIQAVDLSFGDVVPSVTVYGYNTTMGSIVVKPYRKYNVSVQTIITTLIEGDRLEGEREYAKELLKTKQGVPGTEPKPSDSEVGKNNCTARNLKWKPLSKENRNGEIIQYRINLERSADGSSEVIYVSSSKENEEKDLEYTEILSVKANSKYTVTVYASTSVGEGPGGPVSIEVPFCAPSLPVGEPTTGPTQTVKAVDTGEQQQNQIRVELSRSYFTNDDGGPVSYSGIVVAEASKADSDQDVGTNAKILLPGEFETFYANWSTAKQEEDMRPFKINVTDLFNKKSKWKRSVPSEVASDVEPYTIGENANCGNVDESCNGPLNAGKSYKFRAVSCTQGGCTITSYSQEVATAPPPSNGGAIAAGVIVPILIIGIVCGILFFMYRQDLGPFAGKTMRAAPYHHDSGHDNPGIRMEDVPPNPVPLSEFPDHVAKRHQNSDLLFAEEYKLLKELSPRMTWNAAELPYNRNKNRYNNILPYDHSRVKLLAVDEEDELGSDYINANFMPGYNSKREFIANQGPLASTKDDFWRLVWEQNVPIIVMVTKCVEKGRQKCEQYWPNDNEPVYYGDLQVQVRSESVLNNYTIRIIDISMGDMHRSVHHFNFESWPDFGCPDTTDALLKFVMTVRSHRSGQAKGPVVIHCSAGVGRTGTFVCVDRLLQQMRDHDTVDVFGTILEMRRYRTNMVQTEDQYIYIHDCLRDALSQGLHKQYPTNNPQPPPDLRPPQTTEGDDDQHLYENVEISAPQAQIVSEKRVSNGNSTGL